MQNLNVIMITCVSQVVSLCSRRFLELAQMGRGGQAGRGPGWFVGHCWLFEKKMFGLQVFCECVRCAIWMFLAISRCFLRFFPGGSGCFWVFPGSFWVVSGCFLAISGCSLCFSGGFWVFPGCFLAISVVSGCLLAIFRGFWVGFWGFLGAALWLKF